MSNLIAISGRIGSGKDTVGKIIQFLLTNRKRELRGATKLTWETYTDPNNQTRMNSRDWDESGFEIKKFAYKLKQMVSLLTGIPVQDLELQSVKDSTLSRDWCYPSQWQGREHWQEMTVRQLLQKLGTDAIRTHVHQNAWVNALFANYKRELGGAGMSDYDLTHHYPNWIVTDMRFPNEAKAVEKRGGVTIRVERTNSQDGSVYGWGNPNASHPSETALDNYKFKHTINNSGTIEELVEQVRTILIEENLLCQPKSQQQS